MSYGDLVGTMECFDAIDDVSYKPRLLSSSSTVFLPFLLVSLSHHELLNTLRMGSFKLFKHLFPGFLTVLTL
jgi:hypothetical protein